jgi:hypothetical protein
MPCAKDWSTNRNSDPNGFLDRQSHSQGKMRCLRTVLISKKPLGSPTLSGRVLNLVHDRILFVLLGGTKLTRAGIVERYPAWYVSEASIETL